MKAQKQSIQRTRHGSTTKHPNNFFVHVSFDCVCVSVFACACVYKCFRDFHRRRTYNGCRKNAANRGGKSMASKIIFSFYFYLMEFSCNGNCCWSQIQVQKIHQDLLPIEIVVQHFELMDNVFVLIFSGSRCCVCVFSRLAPIEIGYIFKSVYNPAVSKLTFIGNINKRNTNGIQQKEPPNNKYQFEIEMRIVVCAQNVWVCCVRVCVSVVFSLSLLWFRRQTMRNNCLNRIRVLMSPQDSFQRFVQIELISNSFSLLAAHLPLVTSNRDAPPSTGWNGPQGPIVFSSFAFAIVFTEWHSRYAFWIIKNFKWRRKKPAPSPLTRITENRKWIKWKNQSNCKGKFPFLAKRHVNIMPS